jgi:sugar phosphate isomerase/epimerase
VGLTAGTVKALAPAALRRLLAHHGLRPSSLNSVGYVLHANPDEARAQAMLDDRHFAAAAEIGAPVNLIPGGLLHAAPGTSLRDARARALDGLGRLAMRADREGARLSLEPFHPMAIGPRGCINQLSAALAAIAPWPRMGLTLDLHHSWWDADPEALIHDATDRIFVVQICGIAVPQDGGSPCRAELGMAGRTEVMQLLRWLRAAAYPGAIEYEVFHDQFGRPPIGSMLDRAVVEYLALTEEA